ncbi:hypothetical protein KAH94_01975 [bacterium]|nr:hypothetical protein [bacterium]
MNDDDSLYTQGNDNQFVLSYELICLLQWLMENDSEKIKKIITQAFSAGLKEDLLKNKPMNNAATLDDIQESIIDFFGMLESLLAESANEHAVKKALEKNLMPAIDQIDSTVCDNATVRHSVEKATLTLDKHPQENPKELLFKELLRRWKPKNKNVIN